MKHAVLFLDPEYKGVCPVCHGYDVMTEGRRTGDKVVRLFTPTEVQYYDDNTFVLRTGIRSKHQCKDCRNVWYKSLED